jgi:hypothetical protein
MANEAFALSPISARAAQPSEEDYDAISEAFMETARGRWFLGEYAKRNRNADTGMVLDAVARIEQSLAAQKQQGADNRLADALTAIKATLDEARASASAAFDNFALEENLAPVRKGVRVIKEISWRWREIGADGRICDLIDSQIAAIEASCGQISSIDPHSALSAAFDRIDGRLAEFDEREDAPPNAATDSDSASPPSSAPSPVALDETPATDMAQEQANEQAQAEIGGIELTESAQVMPTDEPVATAEIAHEPAVKAAGVVDTIAVTAETINAMADIAAQVAPEIADMAAETADADDEAVLDLIAMEMAAPDPSDMEAETPFPEAYHVDPPLPEPETIASTPEALGAPEMATAMPPSPPLPQPSREPSAERSLEPSYQAPYQRSHERLSEPAVEPTPELAVEPSPEPSLGSSLVASGIVRRPMTASDPLASIRRLSQVEKIALFS